jgi:hypothetical protein
MVRLKAALLIGLAVTLSTARPAFPWGETPGSLVSVSVDVEGRETPLLCATDGSGRFYLEARPGARYALRLANRTAERLGVAVTVDGLNVISGERAVPAGPIPHAMTDHRPESDPGRVYILDPWDTTVIRGWRTSLQDVRQFTFVDERASYAARSGKANNKMGWIEIAVYRERRPIVSRYPRQDWIDPMDREAQAKDESAARTQPPAANAAPPATPESARDEARAGSAEQSKRLRGLGYAESSESYPGTGWGPRADDRAVVVSFDPQPFPCERVTLRYEYARALQALGLLPRGPRVRDRLAEREHAESGFARPPDR